MSTEKVGKTTVSLALVGVVMDATRNWGWFLGGTGGNGLNGI